MVDVTLGPSWELQAALVTVLRADAALRTLLGNNPMRLYQETDRKALKPYAHIGDGQTVPDLADCLDGSEVFLDIHIWSEASSWDEAKKIAATALAAIANGNLVLTENRLLLIERNGERYIDDPDGVTRHAIVTLRALTEPA